MALFESPVAIARSIWGRAGCLQIVQRSPTGRFIGQLAYGLRGSAEGPSDAGRLVLLLLFSTRPKTKKLETSKPLKTMTAKSRRGYKCRAYHCNNPEQCYELALRVKWLADQSRQKILIATT
jgi:hypothetical protein